MCLVHLDETRRGTLFLTSRETPPLHQHAWPKFPDRRRQLFVAEAFAEVALDLDRQRVQRQAIVEALEKTRYNKTAAAKLLGISFRQLRYRVKKLGIE